MLIDCDECAVRDLHCADCVVSVLLQPAQAERADRSAGGGAAYHLDEHERRALAVLADNGLVPHLRLVPVGPPAAHGRAAS